MPFTLPLTLFLCPYFLFSLFFLPLAGALNAAGTLGLVWFAGFVFPKRLSEVRSAAGVMTGACMVAYGLTMLVVATLYETVRHSSGASAGQWAWAIGVLSVLLLVFDGQAIAQVFHRD